jgi:hypothetical protein
MTILLGCLFERALGTACLRKSEIRGFNAYYTTARRRKNLAHVGSSAACNEKSMIDCRSDQSCVMSSPGKANYSAWQDVFDVCLIV